MAELRDCRSGLSLMVCGVNQGENSCILDYCVRSQSKNSESRLYGLRNVWQNFDVMELRRSWLDFLCGKELYLPENIVSVHSTAASIPSREAAALVAQSLMDNKSPFFTISQKMDGILDVGVEKDEASCKLRYLREQKHVLPKSKSKVLMKFSFGAKICLRLPLEELPEGFLDNPYHPDNDRYFYSVMKAYLSNPEYFVIDRENDCIFRKPRNNEELNKKFVFALYYGLGLWIGDFFSMGLVDYALYNYEINGGKLQFDEISCSHSSVSFLQESQMGTCTIAQIDEAIDFIKFCFSDSVNRYSVWESRCFGGLRVKVYCAYYANRVDRNGNEDECCKKVPEEAMKFLDYMKETIQETEDVALSNANGQWNSLMGNSAYCEDDTTRKACENPYFRLLVVRWINRIRMDPFVYADHPKNFIASFARAVMGGF